MSTISVIVPSKLAVSLPPGLPIDVASLYRRTPNWIQLVPVYVVE